MVVGADHCGHIPASGQLVPVTLCSTIDIIYLGAGDYVIYGSTIL